MNVELTNLKLFGRGKDLFDISVSNGIISSIYPSGAIKSKENAIDLEGAWLAPSFVDAHVHTTNTGVALEGLDLSSIKSYAEAKSLLTTIPKSDEIFIGHGWDDSKWDRKADTELFSANCGPIYLSRIDAHSALISPMLAKQIESLQSQLGWSEILPVTQDAHGIAREFAYNSLTEKQRKKFIKSALTTFAANGISAIEEMAGPKISSYLDAQTVTNSANDFGMELKIWWGELFGFEKAKSLGAYGCGGDLFIDGSLGSRTALISAKYDDGTSGRQYISEADCVSHILQCSENGMPTSFHVIGDQAIEIALSSFSKAREKLGSKYSALSHRLEHAEMLTDKNIQQAINLGITLSMQPQFDALWAGQDKMYEDRIGDNWFNMNPFRKILRNGGSLIFSSDSPVTSVNPWETIKAAINLSNSENAISYRAAFKAHTDARNPAKDISPGNVANFAIWEVDQWQKIESTDSRDKWSTDARSYPTDFPSIDVFPKCLATVSNGQMIHSNLDGLVA